MYKKKKKNTIGMCEKYRPKHTVTFILENNIFMLLIFNVFSDVTHE